MFMVKNNNNQNSQRYAFLERIVEAGIHSGAELTMTTRLLMDLTISPYMKTKQIFWRRFGLYESKQPEKRFPILVVHISLLKNLSDGDRI